ncbi:EamA family transporter, partial [Bifidobacterium breve]|nr:EamA family transporter [Bifidobacterium breve]
RGCVGVILGFVGTVLIATGGDLGQLSLPLPGLLWRLTDAVCTSLLAILPSALMAKWGSFMANGVMFVLSG